MTQPNFTCYKPLVPVEHDRHEIGYCDMECPVPVYEGNLFDHMVIFQSVVSWVGWLMSLLLFLTMMFLPRCVPLPFLLRAACEARGCALV
jgi:hypothetical protein